MKKFLLITVLFLAISGGAYYFWKSSQNNSAIKDSYKLVEVRAGNIEEVITSQGKLETKDYVDVGTQVSGQLERLHVELGDEVKKDDLIAEIDPKIYESQVRATEARIKTLEAQKNQQNALILQAQQKFERNAMLLKSDAISKEAYQDTETALKVAKAQLASLNSQIEEANSDLEQNKTNLGYTKIYAPMDGTVVAQSAREGQTLNANQSAPIIVQLANLDIMTVRAQVAEADIMNIRVGMPAYFTILGSQDRKWEGKVRQILPTPDVINDVVLYNVLIDVDNKDHLLMINMSTQMFFTVGKAENVPVLPITALGKRMEGKDDDTGQAYLVNISENGKPQPKLIHVGLMDRTNAQIIKGLKPGDKIYITEIADSSSREVSKRPQGTMRGMTSGPRL